MGAEALAELFAACRAEGRAALLPYLTAGLPEPASSPRLFAAMAEAGADAFEVGIPYSDPLMDGPVIQEAAQRALAAGTSREVGIDVAARVAADTARPVLVMTYVNPVLAAGPETFATRVASAGAAGVIVADLPFDEAGPIGAALDAAGVGLVLFAAPTTTEDRLARIAAARPAFVYGVADLGVTGERAAASDRVEELASRVRAATDAPLVLGVGISTPEQAAAAAQVADGVIVGSALVRRVLEAPGPEQAAESLREAVSALAAAMPKTSR